MTVPIIESIQIGLPQTREYANPRDGRPMEWTSGIFKSPVSSAVQATKTHIEGDGFANAEHHGGIDKAILAYSADHYPDWREESLSGEVPEVPYGGFGENLTIAGLSEATVCIGDRWQVGDVLLEVSQPREPCWKLSRRLEWPTLLKRVVETGRCGWYLRVLLEGSLTAGQTIKVTDRPHEGWTIERAHRLMFDRSGSRTEMMTLMAMNQLSAAWKKNLM